MKKPIKKLVAVLLTIAMVCSFATMAFAANATDANIDTEREGSLTIYKYDMQARTDRENDGEEQFKPNWLYDQNVNDAFRNYAIQGVEFSYVKVADIGNTTTVTESNKASVVLTYAIDDAKLMGILNLSAGDAVVSENGKNYYTSDTIITKMQAIMQSSTDAKDALEAYISANSAAMPETDAEGKTEATGLPVGLYLVVETRVPENVTSTVNPFFVSLPTTVDSNWEYDLTVYPKNETGNPDLEKTVRESQNDTGKTENYAHTASASVGDVVDYEITSHLPAITSRATNLSQYTFVDELSKGIDYNKNDVNITIYKDETRTEAVATWTQADETAKFSVTYSGDNRTMTIAMTEAGLNEINTGKTVHTEGVERGYSKCFMVIHYSATANDDAVMGDSGNPNEVTLTWSRTNTAYEDTLNDDCHVYTYGMDVTKLFTNNDTHMGKFADVHFVLHNDTDNYFVKAENVNGIYYVTDHVAEEKDATTFVPDENGKINVHGLEDDAYTLTETATTDGFQLLAAGVKFTITRADSEVVCPTCEKHLQTASATVNGKLVNMLADGESVNAEVPMQIVNKPGDTVNSGESGNIWMVVLGVCGMAAMAGAMVLVAAKKRTVK